MSRRKKVVVTDHALVRWLQRVHGIDMDFFRNQLKELILDQYLVSNHYKSDYTTQKIFNIDGYVYCLDGKKVVTVYDPYSITDID